MIIAGVTTCLLLVAQSALHASNRIMEPTWLPQLDESTDTYLLH